MAELESANIVLLGNFNPYLISPEWLSKQGIWTVKDVQLALGAFKQDGVQFRSTGTDWHVSSDRLVIASTTLDCGELASKVLSELPHTPMAAVGTNFVFQDISERTQYPVFDRIRETIPKELNSQLLRWGAVLHESEVRIEIAFISGDQGTTISFSHHRTTGSTDEARHAAERFNADKSKSISLIDQILSQKGK